MGVLEIELLKYYRQKNKDNPDLLSLQEIREWLWLECKDIGIYLKDENHEIRNSY